LGRGAAPWACSASLRERCEACTRFIPYKKKKRERENAEKKKNSTASAGSFCGPRRSSERPWATRRPRRDDKRAPWTPRGRRAGRPSVQQARTTAMGCGAAQGTCAAGSPLARPGDGPSSHALAKHGRPASPLRARPTRRVPLRSQAVRLSLHWCATRGRARFRVRARRVARVAHAETARVRPGAEPLPCVSPRRRVADLQACAHPALALTLTLTDAFRAVITGHGPGAHGGVGGVLVSILRLLGRYSYGSGRDHVPFRPRPSGRGGV
jgi:hypothetical protein